MQRKRYVSAATIECLQTDQPSGTGFSSIKTDVCLHEITIEIPDKPVVLSGYWCDMKKLSKGHTNCSRPLCAQAFKIERNCRPITLREVVE